LIDFFIDSFVFVILFINQYLYVRQRTHGVLNLGVKLCKMTRHALRDSGVAPAVDEAKKSLPTFQSGGFALWRAEWLTSCR
jgi:hypothetical protein